MQALDPAGLYTDDEVIDALTGRYGTRTMSYRYDRLSSTNTYLEPCDWVSGGSVANNALADIKRTAKFTILDRGGINYARDRLRPWARLTMPSDGVRRGYVEWPLGVFLLSSPARDLDDVGIVTREVDAYDQLVVLRQDKVTDRYAIAAGTAYTTAITTLITSVGGITALIVPSALTLPAAVEWEPGTTKLRILNDLLGAINYGSAWFDELGRLICRPYQSPADRAIEYTYDDTTASVRTGKAGQTLDLFEVPNKWVGIVSEADRPVLRSEYTNVNPASPTSTVSRGRTIVADPLTELDAADQTTLDAKIARLAFEASQVYEGVKFDTAVMPFHSNADVFALKIPGLAIDGKYSEHTWSFDLAVGSTMSHVVRRVVTV